MFTIGFVGKVSTFRAWLEAGDIEYAKSITVPDFAYRVWRRKMGWQ
jgi:hypothetical protein